MMALHTKYIYLWQDTYVCRHVLYIKSTYVVENLKFSMPNHVSKKNTRLIKNSSAIFILHQFICIDVIMLSYNSLKYILYMSL